MNNKALTWRISVLTATSKGLRPSLFLLNKDGCFKSKYLKQSLCPYSEQKWQGVLPSISLAFISAPAISKACITPKFPLIQAIWRGVLKFLDLASSIEPHSQNSSIRSTCPSFDATCSGVQPSLLHWLRSYWDIFCSWFFRIYMQVIISSFSVAIQIFLKSSLYFFLSSSCLLATCSSISISESLDCYLFGG